MLHKLHNMVRPINTNENQELWPPSSTWGEKIISGLLQYYSPDWWTRPTTNLANWALVSLTIGLVLLTAPHQGQAPSRGPIYIICKTVKNYDILGRDCRRKKGFRFTTNSADQTSRLMHLSSKDEVVECNEIVTDSVIMSNWWTARFQHASLA